MANILAFGEILVRLPISVEGFDNNANIYWGGAEINCLCALSKLGHNSRAITKLPKNRMGDLAINNLKKFAVDSSFILRGGDRIGIYYYSAPQSYMQGEVVYDRHNTSVCSIDSDNINLQELFNNVEVFYVSGISLALEGCRNTIKKLWDFAKANNIKTVFDVNYRSRLWDISTAKQYLAPYMQQSDILFANAFDFSTFLDIANSDEQKLYEQVSKQYGISYISSLSRTKVTHNEYQIQGKMYNNSKLYKTEKYQTSIIERIGGGDCFVAGIVHNLLNKCNNMDIINNATKLVLMKYSMLGDVYLGDLQGYNNNIQSTGDVQR